MKVEQPPVMFFFLRLQRLPFSSEFLNPKALEPVSSYRPPTSCSSTSTTITPYHLHVASNPIHPVTRRRPPAPIRPPRPRF
ncbi:hypothetical protein MA16_Dca000517 [Dendrobium catenatum]|uniref:Uncharacterized protein n=1 Tax=Dendrobium catenatum TaxID=906689 RepID=A0A2I0WU62_9ASPA|nr:hypothetical protein MA16_Dca000517 [Dendrobium catenatum]